MRAEINGGDLMKLKNVIVETQKFMRLSQITEANFLEVAKKNTGLAKVLYILIQKKALKK